MKEFIEKLIGRLEELKKDVVDNKCPVEKNSRECEMEYACETCYLTKTINIIDQLAEEYINTSTNTSSRWVTCSERLPDDFMSMNYLTTVKGRFYSEINYYCIANHKWYSNERSTKEVNVIAWQPLPASYKE